MATARAGRLAGSESRSGADRRVARQESCTLAAPPARTSRANAGVRAVRQGGRAGRRERGAPGGGTCSASSRAGGGEGSESDDRPEATNRQHGFVNATPSGRIYPKSGQLPDAP